eukprot:jgi/Mesen1/6089/ME000031S05360
MAMDSTAKIRMEIAFAGLQTKLRALLSLHEESSKQSKASTSILDLPVGVLEPILKSVCVDIWKRLASGRAGGISGAQVKCMSSVCTRWRDVVRSSYQRACCGSLRNIDMALSQLHTLKNVTHIRVREALTRKHARFMRALATEFPLLTSFHLTFGVEDLEMLSLLLSLKTDIRELQLVMKSLYLESTTWDGYRKALEDMDYTPQVHLKKLTLNFTRLSNVSFPDFSSDGCCIPVSTTLGELAGLQELHVKVGNSAGWANLPLWLAELSAFVGLQIKYHDNPWSSFLDSLGKMTGLKELVIAGHMLNALEYGVVSKMSRLTSLVLGESTVSTSVGPVCLTTTLQKLRCAGEVLPKVSMSLPLLEELTLTDVSIEASQLAFFQRTPNVHFLHLTLLQRKGAWPHLKHLAGLTSLSLDLSPWGRDRKEPVWHICEAQVPALQVLELHSCRLLPLIDGLLELECHVAVSVCCICPKRTVSWFTSHAELVAEGNACDRLSADAARQLFRGTRRSTPKPPGPCFTCSAFRVHDPADDDSEFGSAYFPL